MAEQKKQEQTEEMYGGYKIITEPPNEINSVMRVIVSTMHGTHVNEWIIGEDGIGKAKEFIDNIKRSD